MPVWCIYSRSQASLAAGSIESILICSVLCFASSFEQLDCPLNESVIEMLFPFNTLILLMNLFFFQVSALMYPPDNSKYKPLPSQNNIISTVKRQT